MSVSSTSQVAKKAVASAGATTAAGAAGGASSSKMKLLAIPLARARPGAQPIVTYVAHRPKVAAVDPSSSSSSSSSSTSTSSPSEEGAKKPPLTTRLLNKASDFWIGLGKPGVKSTFDWKRRTYNAGEKLMDRIEYQEWSLKGIDPALGPSIRHPTGQEGSEKGGEGQSGSEQGQGQGTMGPKGASAVPLLYASTSSSTTSNFTTSPRVLLSSLTNLIHHRTPHHRQRLLYCLAGMPITIPFALVPVIPNLPFFYLCWRAFSHWKAYKASEYLGLLIQQRRILPTRSAELEEIINTPAPPPQREARKAIENGEGAIEADSLTPPPPQEVPAAKEEEAGKEDAVEPEDPRIILKPHHIDLLLSRFHLDRQCAQDLRRAREQTLSQLQQASSAAGAGGDANAGAGATTNGISSAAKRTIEELEKTAEMGERDRASEKSG